VKYFRLRLPTICQSSARSISEEMTDAQAQQLVDQPIIGAHKGLGKTDAAQDASDLETLGRIAGLPLLART